MRELTHVAAFGVWLVLLRSGADTNQKAANARPKTRYVTTTYRTGSFAAIYLHNLGGLHSCVLLSNNLAKLLPSATRNFREIATVRRRMCAQYLGAL
jgi:hypothetical protein